MPMVMSREESIAALIGRCMLGWFFLMMTYLYGSDWSTTVILLATKGVPGAPVLLFVGLATNLLGSISILSGSHAKIGALALFAVCDYWKSAAAVLSREASFNIFARNIAIAGGLLLLIGVGPGKFALDNGAFAIRDAHAN